MKKICLVDFDMSVRGGAFGTMGGTSGYNMKE